MGRAVLIALGLGFAAVGCIRDPDPIEIDADAIAVHAMLEAGADSAVVFIARPDEDLLTLPEYRPVVGAEVRLIDGADTTWLVENPGRPCVASPFDEDPSGDGCYRGTLDSPIAEGATYDLEIELPDGARVTGATTVPMAPALARPATGARIPLACNSGESCFGQDVQGPPFVLPVARFQVTWQPDVAEQRFHVAVQSREVLLDGDSYRGDVCGLGSRFAHPLFSVRGDSIDWSIENIACGEPLGPARFDSITADVVVTALDPGYARYLEAILEGSSVRASSVSEGLDGAYGVFGAAAAATREIVLIRGRLLAARDLMPDARLSVVQR